MVGVPFFPACHVGPISLMVCPKCIRCSAGIIAKPLTAVNLGQLNVFEDGAVVDAAALTQKGIIRACKYGLKVLSNGNLTKKLTVKAAAFSGSAKTKIEEAGGKAEVV